MGHGDELFSHIPIHSSEDVATDGALAVRVRLFVGPGGRSGCWLLRTNRFVHDGLPMESRVGTAGATTPFPFAALVPSGFAAVPSWVNFLLLMTMLDVFSRWMMAEMLQRLKVR